MNEKIKRLLSCAMVALALLSSVPFGILGGLEAGAAGYDDYANEDGTWGSVHQSYEETASFDYMDFNCTLMDCTDVEVVRYIRIDGLADGSTCPSVLEIPSSLSYNGKTFDVREIGEGAFENTKIKKVILPDTVAEVGPRAFAGCKKLAIVLSLGGCRFWNGAFSGCTGLDKLAVTDAYFSDDALKDCKNLKTAVVQITTGKPDSLKRLLEICPPVENVDIRGKLDGIPPDTFAAYTTLKSIKLPKGLKYIADRAFAGCTSLSQTYLPDSIETIGPDAFRDCASLREVRLPNELRFPNMYFECQFLYDHIYFTDPDSLDEDYSYDWWEFHDDFDLHDELNDVFYCPAPNLQSAFSGSTNIEKIKVGAGSSNFEIEGGMLYTNFEKKLLFCPKTKSGAVKIPSDVECIAPCAFAGCKKLTEINVAGGNKNYKSEKGVLYDAEKTQLIAIPAKTALRSYVLPASVYRMYDCEGFAIMKSISADKKSKYFSSADGVLFNKSKTYLLAYPGANKRTSYTIPKTVYRANLSSKYIKNLNNFEVAEDISMEDDYTYCSKIVCPNLETVKIGTNHSTYQDLNAEKLNSFKKLKKITVDKNSKYYSVSGGALYNKKKTKLYAVLNNAIVPGGTFNVPATVKTIGENAFSGCANLEKLTIGNSVKTIESKAVFNCPNLKKIYVPASVGKMSLETSSDGNSDIFDRKYFFNDDLMIYGDPGSKAEKYAKNNALKFRNGLYYLPEAEKIAAKPTVNSITLSWKAVDRAAGYRVYLYDTKTKKYKKLCDTSKTGCTLKKLKSGTAYKFVIRAYTLNGKKKCLSDFKAAFITATKPATPKLTVKAGAKKAALKWNKQVCTGYQIYYSTKKNGTYKKLTTVKNAKTVSYTAKKLKTGSAVYFKVRAYRKAGTANVFGDFSAVKGVKIK